MTLTVTDNLGATGTATGTVSVVIPNVAPTASFTSSSTSGQAPHAVTFNASGSSDPDGTIANYAWNYGDGNSSSGPAGTHEVQSHTYTYGGVFTTVLTITDNSGATAMYSETITIAAPNVAPIAVASASSLTGQAPTTITFDGALSSDADGTIASYLWNFGDGSTSTQASPSHLYNAGPGGNMYTVTLTVTDNQGATGSSTVNISAGSGTPPPPSGSDITFDLINAVSNGVIGALVEGATISSSKTQAVNIRVNAPSNTARLGYELYRDGALVKIGFENFVPYAVFGDIEGDYYSADLVNGSYTLVAASYSSTGQVTMVKTIKFTVGSASDKSAFLFPNPVQTDGKVSVRLPEGSSGQFEYSVTNSLGVQVERGTFDARSSKRDVQLSLPNIGRQVQGVYYMTLSTSGSRETIPLIRE